jgi:integration host factor subunit alpha
MTKAEIVNALCEKVGLTRKEAYDFVELLFDTMKETFSQGESIKISGFGTFNVRQKHSRIGRNPKTGVSLEIKPRKVISFKISTQLKEEIETGVSGDRTNEIGAERSG